MAGGLKGVCEARSPLRGFMGPNSLFVAVILGVAGLTGLLRTSHEVATTLCPAAPAVECHCLCGSDPECGESRTTTTTPLPAVVPATARALSALLSAGWAYALLALQTACVLGVGVLSGACVGRTTGGTTSRLPALESGSRAGRRATPLGHLAVDASDL